MVKYNYCPNCFNPTNIETCPHCGYNQENVNSIADALPPMTTLNNRYLVGRCLGQGGFGITYTAFDNVSQKRVAIKECFPEAFAKREGTKVLPKDEKSDPNVENSEAIEHFKKNFKDEIKALYTLRDNPYIVDVTDYFTENATEYFTMTYIDGVNLKKLCNILGGKISYQNALPLLFTVGSTLIDVHRKGLIHRDISPENIMIDHNGRVTLIDFGAAKRYPAGNFDNDPIQIKKHFAPPEQYSNTGNQGPWTDVYALGATFFTLLTGQPLLDAESRQNEDTDTNINHLGAEVPDLLASGIQTALKLDINERYENVEEYFDDISNVIKFAQSTRFDDAMLKAINSKRGPENQSEPGTLHPYAVVQSGKSAGKRVRIPDYGYIFVGRDEKMCKLVIDDISEISRQHCLIGYDKANNRFIVLDRSMNGTFFSNGIRMQFNTHSFVNVGGEFYLYSPNIRIKLELI